MGEGCFKVMLHNLTSVYVNLQGADTFAAKINIEVQWVSELAIAAVEKNGGVITTAFYDPRSLGKNFQYIVMSFDLAKYGLNTSICHCLKIKALQKLKKNICDTFHQI